MISFIDTGGWVGWDWSVVSIFEMGLCGFLIGWAKISAGSLGFLL